MTACDPVAETRKAVHARGMKLKIFEADSFIGDAEVFALDPPMGVAMAKFQPASDYDVTRHANVIDGDYVGDRSEILRLAMSNGSTMKSEAISIQDFFPTLSEREVHIMGIYEPSFELLFSAHPDYRAYYDLDLTDEERAEKHRKLRSKIRRRHTREWTILGALVGVIAAGLFLLTLGPLATQYQTYRATAEFAALSTARTPAVATSSSMPQPQTSRPSGRAHRR